MSRKGGYKILNLTDLYFDTSVSKLVPGIYDLVSALESKVTLISGLDIDDVPQDDMIVTWVNDSGTYKATIGDQTIAVASDDTVLITDGIVGGGGSGPTTVDAEDVTYDNSTSGLEAENVQAAIDELANKEPPTPQIDAEDVDYDNTDSGLQATNVQDAVDEVAGKLFASVNIVMDTYMGEIPIDMGKRAFLSTNKTNQLTVTCNNITLLEVRNSVTPVPFTSDIFVSNKLYGVSHNSRLKVNGALIKSAGQTASNSVYGVGTAVDTFSGIMYNCKIILYIDSTGQLVVESGNSFDVEVIYPYYTT